MPEQVYLDYNATTPVDERVLNEMLPYFSVKFGNASSTSHDFGREAARAVERARTQAAEIMNADPAEIFFTSGSTESLNLAIKGVYEAYAAAKGNHIVTVQTEHKAVLDVCEYLQAKRGAEITSIGVNPEGIIDPDELANAITQKTILVVVMLANNETGAIQDMKAIADIVHAKGSILLSDTTQAAGKMSVDINELGIDIACISAHKLYGPKGAGAVFLRRKNPRVAVITQQHGGGHERGIRSGTLNVAGIVGLGKACEIALEEMWETNTRISALRGMLEHQLLDLPGVRINGSTRSRLYNTSNICFSGKKNTDMILKMKEIAVALGSACSSALPSPSHVLKAMGMSDEDIYSSIRFSLGKFTTEEEIRKTIAVIKNEIYG